MADIDSSKSNIHCYICNSRAGVSIRNAVQIFNSQNKLPTSERELHVVIGEVINKPLASDSVHSQIVCKKCYRLFHEYDELRSRIEEIKQEVLQQYIKTLANNNIEYDGPSARATSPAKSQVKQEVSKESQAETVKQPKSTGTNESILKPESADVKKIASQPLKNVKALPPNVVIVSREGKKIAIQKVNKPLPPVLKLSEKTSEIVQLNETQNTQEEPSAPTQMAIDEPILLKVEVLDQDQSSPATSKKGLSSVDQISTAQNGGQNVEEINYIEDNEEEMDTEENFVISHMEILDGQDAAGLELEEGTIFMEQAADGSIIRVVHHPSFNQEKEDALEEGITEQVEDEEEEDDLEYEEIQNSDGETSIKDPKTGYIRIEKESPSEEDKSDQVSYVLHNGDMLRFDQLVRQVDDQLHECLLCYKPMPTDKEKDKADDAVEDANAEQKETDAEEKKDGEEKTEQQDGFKASAKVLTHHMRIIHGIRIHICEVCGEVFRKRGDLTLHMEEHVVNDTNMYFCQACNKTFSSIKAYRNHVRLHQSGQVKQHNCHICNRKFGSRKLLEEHNNIHIGIRPYTCETCKKTFASKYTYQSHCKTHMDRPRPYTCSQCGKSFFTMQNLTQHEKTHLGIKDFVCNICGKAFGTQHNLEVHGVVHTGYKPFVCRICSKAFARRAEIRDHERIHTGERPYVCDLCGATFSQRSNLQSHKRATHLDDKRYKCRNCDKCFKRRRLLEYHIKASHTGERPYKCTVCDATFVYPEHFKKHTRIHSGEKPYRCEVCDKAFNSRDNRNAHRFIHSDKKPYECLDCGAGFMRKPLLYAHMQSQGHLSDTIIVNQPRLNGDLASIKLGELSGTIILEDGQEVIINNIKEEGLAESQLNQEITLSGTSAQQQQDNVDVFGEELEEDLTDENPKLFVRPGTRSDGEQIIIQAQEETSSKQEELRGLKYLEEATNISEETEILPQRIQLVEEEDQQQNLADGSMRFFQIRMPNGDKGWVALNNFQEES